MMWYEAKVPASLLIYIVRTGAVYRAEPVFELPLRTVLAEPVRLKGTAGSGWMRAGDFDNWKAMVEAGDHRRAQRHKDGYNAKADAILEGYSLEEAEIFASFSYEEAKASQESRNNAITFETLKAQALDFAIQTGMGQNLQMVGSVVALFPGYGTLVGGAMVIGGTMLSAAQQQELVKRAAKEKKVELVRARTRFLKGEITEDEYLAIQRSILQEAGDALFAVYGRGFASYLAPDDEMFDVVEAPGLLGRVRSFFAGLLEDPAPGIVGIGFGLAVGGFSWILAKGLSQGGQP